MNCFEYRRAIGADPHAHIPTQLAHAAGCAACARYRARLQHMDQVIYRALRIGVRAQPERIQCPRRWESRWAAAAMIVAASLLALFLQLPASRESLAQQLVAHVEAEPHALFGSGEVERARLDDVLEPYGVRLKHGIGSISFAMRCWFRGRYVPHLVVRDDHGRAVTVLVLTEELGMTRPEAFREGEFRGVVLPAPRGALAVLGDDAQSEQVAERFLLAVEYQQ